MQASFPIYATFQTVTPSDSTLINCRAIFCGGAGNVALSKDATTASVVFAVTAGQLLPVMLDQGRILSTGTTATLLVSLA